MTIKTYLLFVGDRHYPTGGIYDCVGEFDEFATAMKAKEDFIKNKNRDNIWWQIVNLKTGKLITNTGTVNSFRAGNYGRY